MPFVRIHPTSGYLATYLVALGLELLVHDRSSELAFFWPAAGVGALWMLSARTRPRVVLDGVLLLACTTVLQVLLGADLLPATLFGLSNLAVGATVRLTSSLFDGRPFWGSLPRRLAGTRDLWQIGTACLAAALAGACGPSSHRSRDATSRESWWPSGQSPSCRPPSCSAPPRHYRSPS